MLTRIDLRHFKCFDSLKLPLRPLTLLSGANASGKSSVMQALALLHQTMRENEGSSRLMLNGAAVRLGAVADVIDQGHGGNSCIIALHDDETEYVWEFTGERTGMSMEIANVSIGGRYFRSPKVLHRLLPVLDLDIDKFDFAQSFDAVYRLAYLTAERLGPRDIYPLEDAQLTPVIGSSGENAVGVLYSGGDEPVLPGLRVEGAPPTRLRQVQLRMSQFFPGCELDVDKIPQANAVRLGLRTSKRMDFHRPVHTGFGLTQVLPIVVAALSADRDNLLLIENPEVHLHPAGQATMGTFLAEVASAGVQVILETHSDHVLNGVRRAVKTGILSCADAALHFFRPPQDDEQGGSAQVVSPTLDSSGKIDDWPDGFFDQFDRDTSYFAGWGD